MIREYYRPETLEQALDLLNHPQAQAVPLGGGTTLSRSRDSVAVVDLQSLGWDEITTKRDWLTIGATCSLATQRVAVELPDALRIAIAHECNPHVQNMATAAGALVTGDGRSPYCAVLLAADCRLVFEPGASEQPLGEWLPFRKSGPGNLIRAVLLPGQVRLGVEVLGRSPLDRPQLIVAVGRWPSGRTRIVVGGFGETPILALDGPDDAGAEAAVQNACASGTDAWASAEFRQHAGASLVRRLLAV